MLSMKLERGAQPEVTEVAVGGPQTKAPAELVEVVHPVRLQVSKSPLTQAKAVPFTPIHKIRIRERETKRDIGKVWIFFTRPTGLSFANLHNNITNKNIS